MHGAATQNTMDGITLQNYRIAELVHEGEKTRIYRGYYDDSPHPLIIKTLKSPFPGPEELNRLRREYEIARGLGIEEVPRVMALEPCDNGFALVMEDTGGDSLRSMLKRRLPGVLAFLRMAIRITEALGRIHGQDIVHKDVKPANILINRDTGDIKIIDFGISKLLSRQQRSHAGASFSEDESASILEGSLPYISPEQTGRMNRTVDQRSDFYSLGATFYEMLTGRPPFLIDGNTDPLEIIHCHIAVQPEPPVLGRSRDRAGDGFDEIPAPIANIIMKLLAKNPEDRYQSAFGLKADLQKCLALWKDEGSISNFEIGASDISGKFLLPQRLYGREQEIHALRNLFRRTRHGETCFLLVKGVTGIGKSSLVHDVRRYVAEHRGFFISGNYAELRQDVPYTAFIQAFRDIVRQILMESEASIDRWRRRLREILGPNGSVIADVIPDIELIIGKQDEALQLPAAESQNRFHAVFRGFVRGFADADRPLVLFLDDLHWADAASLQLIKSLVTDPDTRHILLIGAYRDGDTAETRSITQLAVDLARSSREPEAILLGPLSEDNVEAFVADALQARLNETAALAKLVLAKTGGNPFFLNEFLRTLYQDKLIDFNSAEGIWEWDLPRIRSRNITENVADLLTERIRRLPEESQAVLQLAACIGQTFDLYNLAIMHQKTEGETARLLAAPLREGMIVPLVDESGLSLLRPGAGEDQALLSVRYRFMHDRVLQAAYVLLDEDRKILGHVIVGRHLLRTIPAEERDEHLIDIVNHLNLGAALLQSTEQRLELAWLNLEAARKAKRSAAYETSARYVESGHALLPEDPWQSAYELTLALHREQVEILFLEGRAADGHNLAREVLNRTHNLLDRIPVYDEQIRAYNGVGDLRKGLETGLDVLEQLGVRIPMDPGNQWPSFSQLLGRMFSSKRHIRELHHLPRMQDPHHAAAVRLLGLIVPNAYVASPEHMPLLIHEGMRLIEENGLTPYAPTIASAYALLQCASGHIDEGVRASRLALRLTDLINAREVRHRVLFTNAAFVQHWKEPIHNSIRDLESSARMCLESGDYVYYAYAVFHMITYGLLRGANLDTVDAEFSRLRVSVGAYKQHLMAHHLDCIGQVLANIRGTDPAHEPTDLDGGRFSATVGKMIFEQLGGLSGIFYTYSMQAYLSFLFRDIPGALRASREAEGYLEYTASSFSQARQYFISGLVEVGAARSASGRERRALLSSANQKLRKLQEWHESCPHNQAHAVSLLQAELAAERRDERHAAEMYDRSLALARTNGFLNDEALGNELAGEFYLRLGREKIARTYLNDARIGYARWGAQAKTENLSKHYPNFLGAAMAHEHGARIPRKLRESTVVENTRTSSTTDSLDLDTVLQATQALSGEIELEKLLERLIGILLRAAGAERGLFLIPSAESGRLYIEAEQHPGRNISRSLMHIPLETKEASSKLPVPLIEYVRRTGEPVVLADAAGETTGMFARVDYISHHGARSILCMPVKMHGQIAGVLYLENNLSIGAFTPDRVELLEILGTQAAISLENAMLYDEQKKLTDSFARFVPNEFLDVLHKQTIRDIHRGDAVDREITVLFQDIRGFTTLSESLDPAATFRFLNELLERIAPPIMQNNGFIDKYIGDAIMALFPKSPDDGVRGAVHMMRELREFNRERAAKNEPEVHIGVGLHTGMSMFGTLGLEDRLSTTVIGDTVNAASRLESATKKYGVAILISGETAYRLQDRANFHLRELDHVRLKGKKNASVLFEVYDHEDADSIVKKRRTLPAYDAALKQYKAADFAAALAGFESVQRSLPDDAVSSMYIQRCNYWLHNPPGPEWSHLSDLREK